MTSLKVTVLLEVDGQLLAPIIRRLEVDELIQFGPYEKAGTSDATFSAVPLDALDTIQALILTPSQPVTLRFDGQTDAGIEVGADGLVLLCGVTINAGAGASNAKINNATAATAIVRGLGAGT